MEKLLNYQKTHVESIINSLVIYNRALDASDTGTGKTYTSICACKIIGWKPFVICPKSVISSWLSVFEFFNCEYYGITNYELLQSCTYFNSKKEKKNIPFFNKQLIKKNKKKNNLDPNPNPNPNPNPDSDSDSDTNSNSDSNSDIYEYVWDNDKIPDNTLFIFDEAHRCKNSKTINGKIIYNLATNKNIKILILSATVVDKPKYFILAGYILGLYDDIKKGRYWIKKLPYKINQMEGVHKKIYPEYASRMKISQTKNDFPECKIIAESRPMDNSVEIQAAWNEIKQATEELKKQELKASPLPKIIYARQRIELLKVPEFIKLTEDEIKNNNSVVIFVNFTETLLTLSEKLNTNCVIYGDQQIEDRDKNINDFQNDRERICICNIKAGGTGVSLHDTLGFYPRVSIISPTWSAQDLIQVLGRIYRAKAKTKVLQRIIFCKDTVEDEVCKMIQSKVANIAFINDGSMDSYKIEGLTNNLLIPNGLDKIDDDLIDKMNMDNNFSNLFDKVSKLYERKLSLQKELELINTEIKQNEELLGLV